MKLLVLGGTHHVGRAVVETALARGDDVTTLNRGESRPPEPGVTALTADRTDPAALRAALGDRTWDAVIDTWSGAPANVLDAATLLEGPGRALRVRVQPVGVRVADPRRDGRERAGRRRRPGRHQPG